MLFNSKKDGNALREDLSTTLAQLRPEELCEIEEVRVNGSIGVRLQELGLLPGTRVRVLRRAPLGDPTLYEVRGAQLCLRASEARGIRVRRLPS
jgi:ferrous iron transport protein A